MKGAIRHRIRHSYLKFIELEASGGIVLMFGALTALIWANIAAESYHDVFEQVIAGLSLEHWINDGLMAIFFLLVGLEIKRELIEGELSSWKRASLPIFAAMGGMVVPALIYGFVTRGLPIQKGWGIPMATDIAFSLGVLSLLGRRAPFALKVFLTAFAIADDLGAIIVIIAAYTSSLQAVPLLAAAGLVGILLFLNKRGVQSLPLYLVPGALIWFAIYRSGVHASIAGVLVAACIPLGPASEEDRPLERLEHALHPSVAYGIMPLFALANAGIPLAGASLAGALPLGVICGLFIGKPLGIVLASVLAVKLRISALPTGVGWLHVAAAGLLGGIGFTMSIFVAQLAFGPGAELNIAKLAILVGSLMSAMIGALMLLGVNPRSEPEAELVGEDEA